MTARAVLAVLLLGAAASGCGRSRAAEDRAALAASPPKPEGLSLDLTLAADERGLDVELRVTGPGVAAVKALRATRGWADTHPLLAVRGLEVRDETGVISLGPAVEETSFTSLPLARPPSGSELVIRYTARAGAEASRLSLHRGAAGVSGAGHSFIVRPAIEGALPLALRFHTGGLSSGAVLATSLDGRAEATVEDLADAVYVAGALGTSALPSGDRTTVAFGSALDARAAVDVATSARALAGEAFGLDEAQSRAPVSLFVIGERAIGKDHDGAAIGGALAVWLDAARSLDDGAKILIAHEALHRIFGGALRVAEEGRDAAWFSEGFATHYARRVLFDRGLIDGEAFTLDLAREGGERSEVVNAGGARAADYGRGARYAALIDVAARTKSRGKRTLDDVVRTLAAAARKAPDDALSTDVFRAAVAAETGEEKERDLWTGLVARTLPELPEDAFGPCFRRKVDTRTVVELGFDSGSLGGRPQIIRGTVPGSAAERAGVRDGALVLRANMRAGQEVDSSFTVELLLTDPKGKKRVRYKPIEVKRTVLFKPQHCKRSSPGKG